MEKLIKKLDEIFATYNVSDEDIAEVGELIASIGGGELVNEGEDFVVPDMGVANEAETDYED